MSEGLIALALGAGMLAAVNPCGFALLPAYLSLLVVGDDSASRSGAMVRAAKLSVAMTLGFAGVFAAFGLAIAPVASGIQEHLPWFTVFLGTLLAAGGAVILSGRDLKLPRLNRQGTPRPLTASFGSMAGFGAGYAVASLSCTVAPFLAVVIAGFRGESAAAGIALFLAYAAGMGLVVTTVAIATALAHGGLVRGLRRSGRWIPKVSGTLLLASGAYVAYYGWWEIRVLAGDDPSDPVIDAAISIQHTAAGWVQAPGASGWAVTAVVLITGALGFARLRRRTA